MDNIPPITKFYLGSCIGLTVAIKLKWFSALQIYFNPKLIFQQREFWRLFSSFCYFGDLDISFLFHMLFVYRYCKMLEEESYRGKTADFVVLFIFAGLLTMVAAVVFSLPFLGSSFTQVFVYIWSRRNPYSLLNFMGFIIRAPVSRKLVVGFKNTSH